METLIRPAAADPAGGMLRDLHVATTVFCRSQMRAPWGFSVRPHGRAAFHIIRDGGAWLIIEGAGEPLHVDAGDVVVLPRGPGHSLRSHPDAPVEWLDDILDLHPVVDGQLRYGGRGAATDLICGVFSIDQPQAAPILQALGDVVRIPSTENRAWLEPLTALLWAEAGSFTPGATSVAARLADVLLIQAVRHAIQVDGSVRSIFDPGVAAAIRLMRDSMAADWTVSELANRVAASRAAFAARFREAIGLTPMRYLTQLRIAAAAREIASGRASLAEIAARVGYSSEVALSRAFTREMGESPRQYRSRSRAA